jgi:hypothetical protein
VVPFVLLFVEGLLPPRHYTIKGIWSGYTNVPRVGHVGQHRPIVMVAEQLLLAGKAI